MVTKKAEIKLDLEFEDPKEQEKAKPKAESAADLSGLEFAIGGEATPAVAETTPQAAPAKSLPGSTTVTPKAAAVTPTPTAQTNPNVQKTAQVIQHPASARAPVSPASAPLAPAAASVQVRAPENDVEREAAIRVAIAEATTKLIAETYADSKLLEFQINQILAAFNSTNPALQKQLMAIKTLLANHAKIKKAS